MAIDREKIILLRSSIEGGSLATAVISGGLCSVDVTGRYDRRPEIGYYEVEADPRVYTDLRAMKGRIDLASIPDLPPVLPDTPLFSLGETTDGKQFTFKNGRIGSVPEPLIPLFVRIKEITHDVLAHPQHVVRMSGAATKPAFSLDDAIEIDVELASVGGKPAAIDNPLVGVMVPQGPGLAAEQSGTGLQLLVQRLGGGQGAAEGVFVEVERRHLVRRKDAEPSDEPVVSLAKGRTLGFRIRTKLLLQPGRYAATLTLRSTGRGKALPYLKGTLIAELGEFSVRGGD